MADSEPVAFTRDAANRIAAAVRLVEIGDRRAGGIEWETQVDTRGIPQIRLCTWTGTWTTSSSKVVSFAFPTGVTTTAYNAYLGVDAGTGWIARDGTAGWKLVSVRLSDQPGYVGNEIQMLGHDAGGLAHWYSVATCATT